MAVYSLREAAELTGQTLATIRKRADRGTLQVQTIRGQRVVTDDELERTGLLPGAELRALQKRVDELERELAAHRQITERAESTIAAEQQARAIAEHRTFEAIAEKTTAEQRAQTAETALEDLEQQIAGAGPIRAWRLSRQLRRGVPSDG